MQAQTICVPNHMLLKSDNSGACIFPQAAFYPQDTVVDPAFYNQGDAWAGGENYCGTRSTPYLVESGGIGPDGTWYTPDGTSIYLVEAE